MLSYQAQCVPMGQGSGIRGEGSALISIKSGPYLPLLVFLLLDRSVGSDGAVGFDQTDPTDPSENKSPEQSW